MSVRLRRVLFLVASVTLAAAAFGACSGDKVIDPGKIESSAASDIGDQLDLEDVSVDCPSDIKVEEGNVFECDWTGTDADGDEVTGKIEVTQDDDEGNVSWTTTE